MSCVWSTSRMKYGVGQSKCSSCDGCRGAASQRNCASLAFNFRAIPDGQRMRASRSGRRAQRRPRRRASRRSGGSTPSSRQTAPPRCAAGALALCRHAAPVRGHLQAPAQPRRRSLSPEVRPTRSLLLRLVTFLVCAIFLQQHLGRPIPLGGPVAQGVGDHQRPSRPLEARGDVGCVGSGALSAGTASTRRPRSRTWRHVSSALDAYCSGQPRQRRGGMRFQESTQRVMLRRRPRACRQQRSPSCALRPGSQQQSSALGAA